MDHVSIDDPGAADPPVPGDELVIRAERLIAGGAALGRSPDGRVVFVDGALPDETVAVRVTEVATDFARARTLEVVERSPHRVEPRCRHRRAGCGGCDWMHLASSAQLGAKADIVREALRRTGRFAADLVDELVVVGPAVPAEGYRTTLRVIGGATGSPGFRGGDGVVEVDGCPVAHPRLAEALAGLRLERGVELTLRVSAATGVMTAWWESPRRRRRGRPAGTPRPVDGLPRGTRVGPGAHLVERVAGVDLRVSAASFFQSGVAAADLLVDAVRRHAPEASAAGHAVDAYGGIGLFAATVLADASRVTVLESSPRACADARHNLADRAGAVVAEGEVARWRAPSAVDRADRTDGGPPVDLVIADPARPGLARPGVAALATAAPAPIVLVSCDPVSLARDARLLADHGYRPERIEVLDLFPQTHHVETVTRFVHDGSTRSASSGRRPGTYT